MTKRSRRNAVPDTRAYIQYVVCRREPFDFYVLGISLDANPKHTCLIQSRHIEILSPRCLSPSKIGTDCYLAEELR